MLCASRKISQLSQGGRGNFSEVPSRSGDRNGFAKGFDVKLTLGGGTIATTTCTTPLTIETSTPGGCDSPTTGRSPILLQHFYCIVST